MANRDMNIGFYSLGMPHWPLSEFAARAGKHGFNFVVFRISPADQARPLPGDQISLGMDNAELDGIKRMFDQADADRDGRIVPAEFERRPAPRR